MPARRSDRNLLFGILALQMDFISRESLIKAMNDWVLNKDQPLGGILVANGCLSDQNRDLLEQMVAAHIEQHQGDPEKSLAALSSVGSVCDDLANLKDADVQAAMTSISPNGLAGPTDDATLSHLAGSLVLGEASTIATRFQIIRPHAEGGLGKVSVAMDRELNREVALKEIKERFSHDRSARTRFTLEAEITGGLEHPGIVPVYGLGHRNDGQPFYAMRFIKGDSLKAACANYHAGKAKRSASENALEFRKLLGRLIDVCDAIEYAHSRGVLHRDLKPGNIMLGKYGETLVVDWGLAKPIGRDEVYEKLDEQTLQPSSSDSVPATQMGSVVGTPQFMSPEQASGRLTELGRASDVYSLGATLYCLLTNRPPFEDQDVGDVLAHVQAGKFPAPREVDSSIPRALDAICRKAMALRPADRYATPRDLANDISCWLADEPVTAFPEPMFDRAARLLRRHLVPAISICLAIAILLIALAGYMASRWQQVTTIRQQAEKSLAEAQRMTIANQLDASALLLSEAAGVCEAEPRLRELRDRIDTYNAQVQSLIHFRHLAQQALVRGVHGVGSSRTNEPDPWTARCSEALAAFNIEGNPNWTDELEPLQLSPDFVAEIKQQAHDLLIMKAIRLGLWDGQDEFTPGRTAAALELFDQAEALKAPTVGIWMCRMLFFRRQGDDEKADHAGDQMKPSLSEEETAMDHYLLGSISIHILKSPEKAQLQYRQALAVQPNHYGAAFGLALACKERGDSAGELAALDRLLAIAPTDETGLLQRGFALFVARRFRESAIDFEACTRWHPENGFAHYFLGRCRIVEEDWVRADQSFTKAAQLDELTTSQIGWRAITRAHLPDRYKEAIDDIEKAMGAESVSNRNYWHAARVYSLCSAHVLADLQRDDRQDCSTRYANRAIEMLQKSLTQGTIQSANLASSDLDPIRNRKEFQSLLDNR